MLGIGDDTERRVVERFKHKLEPYRHDYATPEMRAKLKRTIMDFIWGLQRTDELPLTHPFMRVVDVEVTQRGHDPRHINLRFTDERGETVNLPL